MKWFFCARHLDPDVSLVASHSCTVCTLLKQIELKITQHTIFHFGGTVRKAT